MSFALNFNGFNNMLFTYGLFIILLYFLVFVTIFVWPTIKKYFFLLSTE